MCGASANESSLVHVQLVIEEWFIQALTVSVSTLSNVKISSITSLNLNTCWHAFQIVVHRGLFLPGRYASYCNSIKIACLHLLVSPHILPLHTAKGRKNHCQAWDYHAVHFCASYNRLSHLTSGPSKVTLGLGLWPCNPITSVSSYCLFRCFHNNLPSRCASHASNY